MAAAIRVAVTSSRVNLIEDLMERSPASRLGIVSIDAEGNRRD